MVKKTKLYKLNSYGKKDKTIYTKQAIECSTFAIKTLDGCGERAWS